MVIPLGYLITMLALAAFTLKDNWPLLRLSLQLWHVKVMAIGLSTAVLAVQKYNHHRISRRVTAGLLILLFWNIPRSFVTAIHTESG